MISKGNLGITFAEYSISRINNCSFGMISAWNVGKIGKCTWHRYMREVSPSFKTLNVVMNVYHYILYCTLYLNGKRKCIRKTICGLVNFGKYTGNDFIQKVRLAKIVDTTSTKK